MTISSSQGNCEVTLGGTMNMAGAANQVAKTFSQVSKDTKKITWELSKIKDPHYCNNRRGGPRSKIYCEVPLDVPHEFHHGRSSGRWFSWKERLI